MAEEYAKSVAEMARRHRREVAGLVDEMRSAETLDEVARIRAELTRRKTVTRRS